MNEQEFGRAHAMPCQDQSCHQFICQSNRAAMPPSPWGFMAQISTLRERIKVMEQDYIKAVDQSTRYWQERDRWMETAAQLSQGADYYRGLVVKIGLMLGDAAFIADDGSRSQDVLCAKVPEIVEARLRAQDAPKPLHMPMLVKEGPSSCVACGHMQASHFTGHPTNVQPWPCHSGECDCPSYVSPKLGQ